MRNLSFLFISACSFCLSHAFSLDDLVYSNEPSDSLKTMAVQKSSDTIPNLIFDLGKPLEKFTNRFSGFLWPFQNDENFPRALDQDLYAPIKAMYVRHRDPEYCLLRDSSATIIYTFGPTNWSNTFKQAPWADWKLFDERVSSEIIKVNAAGFKGYYEFWNEPDHNKFMTWEDKTDEKLFETYRHYHDAVRKQVPGAVIVAPSFTQAGYISKMESFISYCIKNKCIPDYWSWHFPGSKVSAQVRSVKGRNLNRGVLITEYCDTKHTWYPGRTAYHIAEMYESGADGAVRATWVARPGWVYFHPAYTISGLIFRDKIDSSWKKRGLWWVYKLCADMKGDLILSENSSNDIKGFGAYDASDGYASFLIGNSEAMVEFTSEKTEGGYEGEVKLTISGIIAETSKKVKVIITPVPFNGHDAVKGTGPPIVDSDVTVDKGELSVIFDYKEATDAYYVTISGLRKKMLE